MTSRIGKRTREAAIHCLEQCASDRIGGVALTCTDMVYVRDRLGAQRGDKEALTQELASDAWAAVHVIRNDRPMLDIYLEAAALLRDGWNPGDPVEVRL